MRTTTSGGVKPFRPRRLAPSSMTIANSRGVGNRPNYVVPMYYTEDEVADGNLEFGAGRPISDGSGTEKCIIIDQ